MPRFQKRTGCAGCSEDRSVVPPFRTVEEYGLPRISTPPGAPALDSAVESARAGVAVEYRLMFPWIEVAGLARAAGSPTAGMPIAARGYGVSGPGGMTATVPNLGTDWRIDPSQLQSGATGFDPIREDAGAEEYRRQQQSAIESLIDFTNWMKGELPPLDPVGQPSFPDYEKYRRTDAALDP